MAKSKRRKTVEEDLTWIESDHDNNAEAIKEIVINGLNFLPKTNPKNQKQRDLIKKIHNNKIVFVSGPAGSGKTIMALKASLECLKKKSFKLKEILITKPVIEAAGSLGFLPGSKEEKVEPYMHSFYSNLHKLIGKTETHKLLKNNIIKTVPLNYMRGSTFSESIAILDEAQNTTISEMKLFLSRLGEGSKLIVMGDIDQTDLKLKNNEITGLQDAFTRLQGVEGVDFVEFTEDDIVRSSILIEIMKRYKNP